MFAAGLLLLRHDRALAGVILGLFALFGVAAVVLWVYRESLPFFPCLQVMMGLLAALGFIVVWQVDRAGFWGVMQIGSNLSARSAYWIIGGVAVAGMGLLWLQRWLHTLPPPTPADDPPPPDGEATRSSTPRSP